jgi:hypothetical protein
MVMKTAVPQKLAEMPKRSPDVRDLNGTVRSYSMAGQMAVLQRTIGNRAVERLFRSGVLQTKVKIGQQNNVYEQEADRVAEQVMRMPEGAVSSQQSAVSRKGEFGGLQVADGGLKVGGRQTVDSGLKGESLRLKPG